MRVGGQRGVGEDRRTGRQEDSTMGGQEDGEGKTGKQKDGKSGGQGDRGRTKDRHITCVLVRYVR